MNIISNTLISLESDSDIKLTLSITSILDEDAGKFAIQIGDIEHDISIETIDELIEVLHKLKYLTNNVN
jgi:hypothetical protein